MTAGEWKPQFLTSLVQMFLPKMTLVWTESDFFLSVMKLQDWVVLCSFVLSMLLKTPNLCQFVAEDSSRNHQPQRFSIIHQFSRHQDALL